MTHQDKLQWFRFMPNNRPRRKALRTIWALNGGAGLLMLGGAIILAGQWFISQSAGLRPGLLIGAGILALFYLSLDLIKTAGVAWVTSSDIALGEDGVHLYLRDEHCHVVPWEVLHTIREARPKMLFGPTQKDDKAFAIRARGLPFVYRLAGNGYGQVLSLIFVVTTRHADYEALVETLKRHLSQTTSKSVPPH